MKRRKINLGIKDRKQIDEDLNQQTLTVIKSNNYFEIGTEITNDVAEAVSILMKKTSSDDPIWRTEVNKKSLDGILPEKTLYWLSGGDKEWRTLDNYLEPWSNCYSYYEEEFGKLIIEAVEKSKTLADIRDYFIKYLNLPILYDFAIKIDIVR